MIGLVLLLLLPTPTIWCSLDHKRNVSDGIVIGIGTLFSLDHKLYASDYDSDSVAIEKQPMTPLTTLLFDFHLVISALTTPTPSLVKTSLKASFTETRRIQSHVPNFLLTRRKSPVLAHAVHVKCDV